MTERLPKFANIFRSSMESVLAASATIISASIPNSMRSKRVSRLAVAALSTTNESRLSLIPSTTVIFKDVLFNAANNSSTLTEVLRSISRLSIGPVLSLEICEKSPESFALIGPLK